MHFLLSIHFPSWLLTNFWIPIHFPLLFQGFYQGYQNVISLFCLNFEWIEIISCFQWSLIHFCSEANKKLHDTNDDLRSALEVGLQTSGKLYSILYISTESLSFQQHANRSCDSTWHSWHMYLVKRMRAIRIRQCGTLKLLIWPILTQLGVDCFLFTGKKIWRQPEPISK